MKHACKKSYLITLFLIIAAFSQNSFAGEVININKADTSAFQLLKGIGEKKSKMIVLYRKKHGQFKTINDLTAVKGIGPKTIQKNKAMLSTTKGIKTAPKIKAKLKEKIKANTK